MMNVLDALCERCGKPMRWKTVTPRLHVRCPKETFFSQGQGVLPVNTLADKGEYVQLAMPGTPGDQPPETDGAYYRD